MLLNCIFSMSLGLFNVSTILITGSTCKFWISIFTLISPLFHCFFLFLSLSLSCLLFSSCASRLSQALIDLAAERSICARRKGWEQESERKKQEKIERVHVGECSAAVSGWTEARVIMKGRLVWGLCTWHTTIYHGFCSSCFVCRYLGRLMIMFADSWTCRL